MELNKKKILCLIPSLGTGGAERQMVELIKCLNENNIQPYVLTYYGKEKDYEDDFNINRIVVSEPNFIWKYVKIIREAIKVKPDVIISYGGIPNMVSILISMLSKKIRIVVSERNTSQNYGLSEKFRFNLYRFADIIVPNSISQTDFIKEHAGYLDHKLRTITNYTDINSFSLQRKERKDILKIGIFARYHPQKNILLFLKAVHEVSVKYPNVEYHWFGQNFLDQNGNPTKHSEYYISCKEARDSLGLENVYFHDFSKNVREEFKNFDAICLPSLYEGFSNILSEAICCGKLILASAVCDNVLFVKDGENGYSFNPKSIDSMTSAIEKMILLNDQQVIEFQNRSRAIAETLFSKERFINSYLKVLIE